MKSCGWETLLNAMIDLFEHVLQIATKEQCKIALKHLF